MAKFMSRERIPVPIEQEAGEAPRLDWTFWRGGKSVATAGIRTTDRPALHRLLHRLLPTEY